LAARILALRPGGAPEHGVALGRARAASTITSRIEMAMAHLDQATKRLQDALDRLERVVEARLANGSEDGEKELRAALAAARKQNAAVQKTASTVAARLDSTIARIKATLEA
jgi:hypothetical protein